MGRRIPQQERARRRVEMILEAAATCFADIGFERTTMDQIAQKAETSVGSIYQFYPNKQALFDAVADRCLSEASALLDTDTFAGLDALPWRDVVSVFLDAYYAWEANIYMRALNANLQLYGRYESADKALTERIVSVTSEILKSRVTMKKPQRQRVARTLVNSVTAFFFFSRDATPKEAKLMFQETKAMVLRYLEPYMTR